MTDHPIVAAISEINFSGHVIPCTWFDSLKMPSGKPDLVGIMLLSEIVYWYRYRIVRDEQTGGIISREKKFAADKLQKSYQALANQFGFSKRQVTDSLKRLRDKGLLTLELRIVEPASGVKLANVLYIEPCPEKIRMITYPAYDNAGGVSRLNVTPPTKKRKGVLRSAVTPPTVKRGTNTKITTDIYPPGEYLPENQISGSKNEKGFADFWGIYPIISQKDKPKAFKFFSLLVSQGTEVGEILKAAHNARRAADQGRRLPTASRFLGFGEEQPWRKWISDIPRLQEKRRKITNGGPFDGHNVMPNEAEARVYDKFKFI